MIRTIEDQEEDCMPVSASRIFMLTPNETKLASWKFGLVQEVRSVQNEVANLVSQFYPHQCGLSHEKAISQHCLHSFFCMYVKSLRFPQTSIHSTFRSFFGQKRGHTKEHRHQSSKLRLNVYNLRPDRDISKDYAPDLHNMPATTILFHALP